MNGRDPASFRDPAGFVFRRDRTLFRQVNQSYGSTYEALRSSGLLGELTDRGLLVAHDEVDVEPWVESSAYRVLQPALVPFVSYPYEWCPGQLRAAALATLDAQLLAMDHGLTLKDASAYNVQFWGPRATLIDTLSFEEYEPGAPWKAYGQFCRHFLAPLALARMVDPRLVSLSQRHLDGVPLDLAVSLLPVRSRYRWGLGVHLHAHASAQRRHAGAPAGRGREMSRQGLRGLVESLRATVDKQRWQPPSSAWSEYYSNRESYSSASMEKKLDCVAQAIDIAQGAQPIRSVWDLGANTGQFSELAGQLTGGSVVALEADVSASEVHWRNSGENVLSLVSDLTNPSPALGWAHRERSSLVGRGPADLTMALALVHHLAIGNNVPLEAVVAFIASTTSRFALVEWVPKSDPMVQRMLQTREDVFPHYRERGFRHALEGHFVVLRTFELAESQRTLYLLELSSRSP